MKKESQSFCCSSIRGIVSCGEPQRRERGAPFQKRPYMYAYSMVILNAFPLLTVDKKLSLEVTSKLERLEYSYKHCTDKEGAMVGV